MRARRGMSAVEILVSMAVLSILFMGVQKTAGVYFAREDRIREAEFRAEAASISQGVFYYCFYEGKSPGSFEDLYKGGYLIGDGLSPWGGVYHLEAKGGGWEVWAVDKKGKRYVYAVQ